MYLADSIFNNLEWYQLTLIIGGAICIVGTIILLVVKLKKGSKKIEDKIVLRDGFVDDLVNALGGIDNIINVVIANKRLGVGLKSIKLVSQDALKAMEISAFMSGNQIKILLKIEPESVYEMLQSLIGGK